MTSERFSPVEVLHRDVEVAAFGAVLVDRRHIAAGPAECSCSFAPQRSASRTSRASRSVPVGTSFSAT